MGLRVSGCHMGQPALCAGGIPQGAFVYVSAAVERPDAAFLVYPEDFEFWSYVSRADGGPVTVKEEADEPA